MNWTLIATFAAPILSGIIIFLLQKNYQNRPNLIVFFKHISAHTIPNTSYKIFIIAIDSLACVPIVITAWWCAPVLAISS